MGLPGHSSNDHGDPRILVVDPFPLVRDAVGRLLTDHGVTGAVSEADNPGSALATCAKRKIDILVTDVDITARRDGIHLCRKVKDLDDAPKVLILSSVATPDVVAECLSGGADSFVHRSADSQLLVNAITTIVAAQQPIWFVGPAPKPRPEQNEQTTLSAVSNLTAREREIFSLLLMRFSNDEIAKHLHLAQQTVKNYVSAILQKLDVGSRAELFASPYGAEYRGVVHRMFSTSGAA